MKNKLIEFMRLCVSDKVVPLSWGIRDIAVSTTSVSFYVYGSRKQIKVLIRQEKDVLVVSAGLTEIRVLEVEDAINWLDAEIE